MDSKNMQVSSCIRQKLGSSEFLMNIRKSLRPDNETFPTTKLVERFNDQPSNPLYAAESNKVIGLYLSCVENDTSQIVNYNMKLMRTLDDEMGARLVVENEVELLKAKYEEETEQLKKQAETALFKKEEIYLKSNTERSNLQAEIIKWKREFRWLRKELTRENEKYRVLEWELNGVRKEQVKAEEALTKYKAGASKFINFERKRLNEKCVELTNEKRGREKLMEEFRKMKEQLKDVTNDKKELLKENESLKETLKLRKQVNIELMSGKGDRISTMNTQVAALQKKLDSAEKDMKKYESKFRDAKAQLKDAKKLIKHKPSGVSSNQKCIDCDEKVRQLEVLQDRLKKKESEAREMFEQVQSIQQSTPVNQPQGTKNKKELLMDLLPTSNLISEKDLTPVMQEGKPVIIGQGTFGKVSLMKYAPINSFVAVKSIFNGNADDIFLEARAMQLASVHPSFPAMFGIVKDNEGIPTKLVSEFIGNDVSMQCMSFQSAISKKFINISKASLKTILLNICNGLGYLHKHNIVHNDIKAENILIDCINGQFVAKIIDMGGITSPLVEPPAAEATSSDIFALGVIMQQAAGAAQWLELDELAILCKKNRPPINDVISLITSYLVC